MNEKQRHEAYMTDLAQLLTNANFRRFAWNLIGRTGVLSIPKPENFNPEATHVSAYNEGARMQGLVLMTEIISVSPEAWLQMQKEGRSL